MLRLDHVPTDADIDQAVAGLVERLESPSRCSGGWRRELIYFLMIDRFNDRGAGPTEEFSHGVPMDVAAGAPFTYWRWDDWAVSGRNRFQGGTLRGVIDRLPYLAGLGITTIWLSPPWRQRAISVDVNLADADSDDPYDDHSVGLKPGYTSSGFQSDILQRFDYHGYAVQDFLDVDPRFGTIEELVELVRTAHLCDPPLRVVLDIQLNHTGVNFAYDAPGPSDIRPPYRGPGQPHDDKVEPPYPQGALPENRYPFGAWLDAVNRPMSRAPRHGAGEAVWPRELQNRNWYNRKGEGSYGNGDFDLSHAEFRISDFRNRDLRYNENDAAADEVLEAMVRIWTWWIATTDCDGFRVDAIKHVPPVTAMSFAEQIRRFAREEAGKDDFLVVGEVGGSDAQAATYLSCPDLRVLCLGDRRANLRQLAGGSTTVALSSVLQPSPVQAEMQGMSQTDQDLVTRLPPGSLQERVVCTIDDHDGLGTPSGLRLAGEQGPNSLLPAVALLLFGPGIPCLYYGLEQCLTGVPDLTDRELLSNHGLLPSDKPGGLTAERTRGGDRYLREAMFGPTHPAPARPPGEPGSVPGDFENSRLPGFGPTVTGGKSALTPNSPWYMAVAELATARRSEPGLALGDIDIIDRGRVDGGAARSPLPVGVMAWTRTWQDVVALVVTYADRAGSSTPSLGHDIAIELRDALLGRTFKVIAQVCTAPGFSPTLVGAWAPVQCAPQTRLAYVDLGTVLPGEVRVLIARAQAGGNVVRPASSAGRASC